MGFLSKKIRRLPAKTGSLAFYICIPVFLFLSYSLSNLLFNRSVNESYSLLIEFTCSTLVGYTIFMFIGLRYQRTFFHELKHLLLVTFSGNKAKKVVVKDNTGSVDFTIEESDLKFRPFINLAPYTLPIFSLLSFIFILFSYSYLPTASRLLLLSLPLGLDLQMNAKEAHSQQSDLKDIRGGLLASYLFILSANFFWFIFCLCLYSFGPAGIAKAGLHVLHDFSQIIKYFSSMYYDR